MSTQPSVMAQSTQQHLNTQLRKFRNSLGPGDNSRLSRSVKVEQETSSILGIEVKSSFLLIACLFLRIKRHRRVFLLN